MESNYDKELIYKTETDSPTYRTGLWLPRGRWMGEGRTGSLGLAGASDYIEWINKVLLYSTGNYIQHPVINHNGKEYKKRIYVYIYE